MNNLPISTIVIHCSDSPHRGDTASDVHAWHQENGWAGIGYHYTIDETGKVEAGRPEYWQGAHVRYHNSHSIGIMLFGVSYFTEAQFSSLETLLRDQINKHGRMYIRGHCDLDPKKTCPNFDVKRWCWERNIASG